MKKKALVCGAGGFIGGHLVNRLIAEGYEVTAVDIKPKQEWFQTSPLAKNLFCVDLTNRESVDNLIRSQLFDEIYQLAADMGGAGYIFTGENDAAVMHNSASINLNVLQACANYNRSAKIFYSSSACIYPEHNQLDPNNPNCEESSAYPANPDSEYGWEKLFSERLYRAYARNLGLNVRIARFHNIFGPFGSWDGGKEKAPAAMCRKALLSDRVMEVWGPGTQTRSFLYIDDCIEAVRMLMDSDCEKVINIGSEEMVSINTLAEIANNLAGRSLEIKNIDGPIGVMGRCSDNRLIEEELGWKPKYTLREGMKKTLTWIATQL